MASIEPFEQLTGQVFFWLAPYGEPIPEVNVLPTGNWIHLGDTDGDQKLKHGGKTVFFKDNGHQSWVKAIRPDEEVTVGGSLVDLTLEHYARVIHDIGRVQELTTPGGVSIKKMALKRGATFTPYALLVRGPALSPYGIYPGQYVLPRVIQTSEPQPTFGRDKRIALDLMFNVLEDDSQPEADSLGWFEVQIAG
jgi:hypothetical protein